MTLSWGADYRECIAERNRKSVGLEWSLGHGNGNGSYVLEHEHVYKQFTGRDCVYGNGLRIHVYAFWSFAFFLFLICVFLHALTSFVCVLVCVCVVCVPVRVYGLQVCTEPKAVGLCPVSGNFEARQSPASLSTWLVLTVDSKILVRLCNDSDRHPELRACVSQDDHAGRTVRSASMSGRWVWTEPWSLYI